MIPDPNVDHVVLRSEFAMVNELVSTMQDANVLPRLVPATGDFGEHRQEIGRLDVALILRYQLAFDDIRLDAFVEAQAPGGNDVRLGVPLRRGAIEIVLEELSSGDVLSRFQYAISGRAFIWGSIETDTTTKAPHFIISRLPEFLLDDQANKIPPFLPKDDIQKVLGRAMNREIRARPQSVAQPGLISFPISFEVKDLLDAEPITYGMRLTDPAAFLDPLSKPICLPPGSGSGSCDPTAQPVEDDIFRQLQAFLRVATANDPALPNSVGRPVQLDVGYRIIDRELRKKNGWKAWKEVAAKMFRFRPGQWIYWKQRGDGTGSIKAEFRADLQVAYPKVKMCTGWTKLPFGGKVKYKYPCGVERGWHGVKSVHAWVEAHVEMVNNRACVVLLDHGVSGKNDVIGFLLTAIYALVAAGIVGAVISLLSPLLAGAVTGILLASVGLVLLVLATIDLIVDKLLEFLPDQYCSDVKKYLTVPVIQDKIDVVFERNLVTFDRNGVIVASDPDFKVLEPKK